MEFVVQVLETVFQKSPAEAYRIMMQVHLNGRGTRRRLSVGNRRNQSRNRRHPSRARPDTRCAPPLKKPDVFHSLCKSC